MKQWCRQRRAVAGAILSVLLPLTLAPIPGWGKSEAVDIILHGGKVLTIDPAALLSEVTEPKPSAW